MNTYYEQEFTLASLIKKEKLTLEKEIQDFDAVIEHILPKDLKTPLIIGIDGSVTAGKSFLSSRMEAWLTYRGIDCVVIHGDWYMSSRKTRMQEAKRALKGSYDITLFDQAVCDYEKITSLQKHIIDFLQSGEKTRELRVTGAYSRTTGELDDTIDLAITTRSVIIFEGTGVLNSAMKPGFDLAIRVDVATYDETIKRLYGRETEKEEPLRIPKKLVKQRYDLIDYRYDGYLRSRDSRYFDVLLDTSNITSTTIYTRN